MQTSEIESLYVTFGPMVIRRCRALLRHEADALEASQEVFVKLIERADSLDLQSAPSSLLYRIATNHCLNRIRAQHKRSSPSTEHNMLLHAIAQHTPEDHTVAERRSSLRHLFRRQSESTRYIAVLYWVEQMTLQEVALEVDMSVSGVRKRLRQLRAQLAPTIATLRDIEEL